MLPLLYYSFVLMFYLTHSSAPFLSPLSCPNSSILGLNFLDLLSDNEHSDVNTNCSYLSGAVLKSLLAVNCETLWAHCVVSVSSHIPVGIGLCLYFTGYLFQIPSKSFQHRRPLLQLVNANTALHLSFQTHRAAQATSPFLELPAAGGLERYLDSAQSKICLCGEWQRHQRQS